MIKILVNVMNKLINKLATEVEAQLLRTIKHI